MRAVIDDSWRRTSASMLPLIADGFPDATAASRLPRLDLRGPGRIWVRKWGRRPVQKRAGELRPAAWAARGAGPWAAVNDRLAWGVGEAVRVSARGAEPSALQDWELTRLTARRGLGPTVAPAEVWRAKAEL